MPHRHAPSSISQRVGKILSDKRTAAGYSQLDVAEYLEIGTEAYSRIERGIVHLTIERAFILADMFSCSVDSLIMPASQRVLDQTSGLNRLLSQLTESDRNLVVSLAERMAYRLTC